MPCPRLPVAGAALIATLLATSATFGLPHVLIPLILGPERPYTPFAVSGVSALTYDKSSTYAAYVNYTAVRNAPPNDTDIFEHRDEAAPTSSLPYLGLAALNHLVGGVDAVFIVCDFVLPSTAALLLFILIYDLTTSPATALVGAVATILIPFGPRNFLGTPFLLMLGHASYIDQPLEYSRLVHPELSFTMLLAALLLLWRTLVSASIVTAALAGLWGGGLFYTYFYYWPVWLGACALLLLASVRWHRPARIGLWITNVVTWIVGIPFWLSLLQGVSQPGFSAQLERHISETGHLPPPDKLILSLVYTLVFSFFVGCFLRSNSARSFSEAGIGHRACTSAVVLFNTAVFVSAIAAMNMEVVTGFNLEAMLHFPNRVFQPYLAFAAFTLMVPSLAAHLRSRLPGVRNSGLRWAYGGVVVLLGIAFLRQVTVSGNVADKHAQPEEYRLLFNWLNANTGLDDVLLSPVKEINDLIPVYTRDRVFVPNAERTSASYDEIMRRFLIAMKLLDRPPEDVRYLLAQDHDHGDQPVGLTYTYFLFIGGHGISNWRLPDREIAIALSEYEALALDRELARWRLDYVYGRSSERPVHVAGWTFNRVYSNAYGSVWQPSRVVGGLGTADLANTGAVDVANTGAERSPSS